MREWETTTSLYHFTHDWRWHLDHEMKNFSYGFAVKQSRYGVKRADWQTQPMLINYAGDGPISAVVSCIAYLPTSLAWAVHKQELGVAWGEWHR